MLLYSRERWSLLFLFFVYFFFEVCIGGSGGLLRYHELTLRKVNFVIAICITGYLIYKRKKLDYATLQFTFAFLILLFADTLIGLLNYGFSNPNISENFLAESFFILLPFYPLFVNKPKHIKVIQTIIVWAAVVMAVAYIALLMLLFTGVLNFRPVYLFLSQSEEFMGRGNVAFWYKGFIYMCIGLYFMNGITNVFLRRVLQVIILLALVLTCVRGFILALFATAIIYELFFRNKAKALLIIVAGIAAILILRTVFESVSFNREESDRIREMQLQQVKDAVSPVSFIVGHGFGDGVRVRKNHMEINYLEIFHKQGIIGIAFWLYMLAYIIINYINVKKLQPGNEPLARSFLLATFFVYIESITNPFLTNSIGLNIIMISIVCLNVLKRNYYPNTSTEQ